MEVVFDIFKALMLIGGATLFAAISLLIAYTIYVGIASAVEERKKKKSNRRKK